MKCKRCKREIEDKSIYCSWCGFKQLSDSKEIRVPAPQRKGNTWYAQVTVKGERAYVSAPSEDEYYVRARAAKLGLIEAVKPDNRLVKDLVAEYIKAREKTVSPATIDGYERKSRKNLQSLYNLRVKDMTKAAVQQAINADLKTYSGKTVWEAWSLIQSATGVRYDGLVLPSKRPQKKPPVYTSEQLRALLQALAAYGGQTECAALLALWLSLRRSEIMGLKWCDVMDSAIRVQTARVYDKSHKLVEKQTKNETSERLIPCDKYILDKINALPKGGEYVFTESTSGLWKGIDTVCKNAGVPHGYLHGFRHTNATIMEMLGVPAKYSNKRGGWASDHIRQRTYTDTMTEGDLAAAGLIDGYLNGLITTQPTTQEKKSSNNAQYSDQ